MFSFIGDCIYSLLSIPRTAVIGAVMLVPSIVSSQARTYTRDLLRNEYQQLVKDLKDAQQKNQATQTALAATEAEAAKNIGESKVQEAAFKKAATEATTDSDLKVNQTNLETKHIKKTSEQKISEQGKAATVLDKEHTKLIQTEGKQERELIRLAYKEKMLENLFAFHTERTTQNQKLQTSGKAAAEAATKDADQIDETNFILEELAMCMNKCMEKNGVLEDKLNGIEVIQQNSDTAGQKRITKHDAVIESLEAEAMMELKLIELKSSLQTEETKKSYSEDEAKFKEQTESLRAQTAITESISAIKTARHEAFLKMDNTMRADLVKTIGSRDFLPDIPEIEKRKFLSQIRNEILSLNTKTLETSAPLSNQDNNNQDQNAFRISQ